MMILLFDLRMYECERETSYFAGEVRYSIVITRLLNVLSIIVCVVGRFISFLTDSYTSNLYLNELKETF